MIEHVVMLNVRNDDPAKVQTLTESLSSLASLSEVLYLTVGPIHRRRTCTLPEGLHFTHFSHARYPSLSHLKSYFGHPTHGRVAVESMPIVADVMAFDWAWPTDPLGPKSLLPGRALRFTSFKLKDGAGDKKREILEGLRDIKESCEGTFEEMTYGEEFLMVYAKGFSLAAVAVFRDLDGLDAGDKYEGSMNALIAKLEPSIDSVISVDYVVPHNSHNNTTSFISQESTA